MPRKPQLIDSAVWGSNQGVAGLVKEYLRIVPMSVRHPLQDNALFGSNNLRRML